VIGISLRAGVLGNKTLFPVAQVRHVVLPLMLFAAVVARIVRFLFVRMEVSQSIARTVSNEKGTPQTPHSTAAQAIANLPFVMRVNRDPPLQLVAAIPVNYKSNCVS
jgi:hypothetical protein